MIITNYKYIMLPEYYVVSLISWPKLVIAILKSN